MSTHNHLLSLTNCRKYQWQISVPVMSQTFICSLQKKPLLSHCQTAFPLLPCRSFPWAGGPQDKPAPAWALQRLQEDLSFSNQSTTLRGHPCKRPLPKPGHLHPVHGSSWDTLQFPSVLCPGALSAQTHTSTGFVYPLEDEGRKKKKKKKSSPATSPNIIAYLIAISSCASYFGGWSPKFGRLMAQTICAGAWHSFGD